MRRVAFLTRVCVFLLWLLSTTCQSSSSAPDSISPIRDFEPSLVASAASATAIAMKYQNFMILLVRSPASRVYRPSLMSEEAGEPLVQELSGLRVSQIKRSTVQFAPSWISLGPNSVCAMTGLASDVEHLCRVTQKEVDSHWNVFDRHMTTHSITLGLADTMASETLAGSRPYGVQCLLLGGDDIDPKRIFGVYTIDPSGVWQSWGGITAVGKYAKNVREALAKKRCQPPPPQTLRQAVEQVIDCWMEACKSQNANVRNADDDDYQVILLEKKDTSDAWQIYMVNEDELKGLVEEAITTPSAS